MTRAPDAPVDSRYPCSTGKRLAPADSRHPTGIKPSGDPSDCGLDTREFDIVPSPCRWPPELPIAHPIGAVVSLLRRSRCHSLRKLAGPFDGDRPRHQRPGCGWQLLPRVRNGVKWVLVAKASINVSHLSTWHSSRRDTWVPHCRTGVLGQVRSL